MFNPISYKANVTEGLPPGAFVTKVNASEKDEGDKGRMVYKITSGDPDGYFTINNSTVRNDDIINAYYQHFILHCYLSRPRDVTS